MHWSTLLLPFAVSAVVLEERQGSGTPVASIDELKPQFRKNARRTLTKLGRTLFLCTFLNSQANFHSIYYQSSSRESFYLFFSYTLTSYSLVVKDLAIQL
jgi:hypothetical protein